VDVKTAVIDVVKCQSWLLSMWAKIIYTLLPVWQY